MLFQSSRGRWVNKVCINKCEECNMICCNKNPIRKDYLGRLLDEVEKEIKTVYESNPIGDRQHVFNYGIIEALKVIKKHKGGE